MKKTVSLIISVALIAMSLLAFSSCGEKAKPTIGIIQFGSHESLVNCYEGIILGLRDSGIDLNDYNVELLNSNFDPSVSQSQAKTLVNKGAKVIIAIATPSAVAAANAADGAVPVVYCAVTDGATMANYENVTGSSDIPNAEKQLEVVMAYMGKTDSLKIGVLYSTEESSSPLQVANLKKAAEAVDSMNVTIVDKAVADINTIDTAVNSLIDSGIDCFANLLDNTIVGKLESNILPITMEKKIPVFGSEVEQVKKGCVASSSIDYKNDVGMAAGKAAAEILGGKNASDIPPVVVTNPQVYINSAACEELGLKLPENTLGAKDVSAH